MLTVLMLIGIVAGIILGTVVTYTLTRRRSWIAPQGITQETTAWSPYERQS